MAGDWAAEDWARPVVHWEIVARNLDRQSQFYREMFNWDVPDGDVRFVAAGLGGPEPGPGGHLRQGDAPSVSLYVQVRDLRASLVHAVELGATITAEPLDLPGGPTIAAITDPEGNPVGLVQQ